MAKVRAEIALDMRFISRIDGDSGIDVPNGSFLMSYSGPFALTDWGTFSGRVAGFQQTWNGNVVFRATNVDALASDLLRHAAHFDGDAFLKVAFAKDDVITGSGWADYLRGEGGNDVLGGGGRDTLLGGIGDDRLDGGVGRDILRGGAGADRLIGGAGADALYGGAGDDIFRFNSGRDATGDRIHDFQTGDRIDLSAIDADLTRSGDQAFVLGHAGAGGLAIAVVGTGSGAYTRISADLDGDGHSDFSLTVSGTALAHAGDHAFLL